ncbi:MAG: cobalt-precorrin-6A reductase [Micropruina sp.]
MTVLLLGGTVEARRLAAALVVDGVNVLTSLAGAVAVQRPPAGCVRVGGFGGADGLAGFSTTQHIAAVVDATHPFAARITASAAEACGRTETPLLRLCRPGWGGRPDAAGWHWVASSDEAAEGARRLGERIFLSVGRRSATEFLGLTGYVLLRAVEPPTVAVPESWEVLTARGPFDLAAERALLRNRRIDVLVTKDSGGRATAAKLDAAAELGVPVVIVARPAEPSGLTRVETVDAAVRWLGECLQQR